MQLKHMNKACHSAPAEVMIMNVSGKNSQETALTFYIFIKNEFHVEVYRDRDGRKHILFASSFYKSAVFVSAHK